MKKLILLSVLFIQTVQADQQLDLYFSFLKQLGQPNGNYREGEIEVVTEPAEISKVQKVQENRLLQKGFSAASAKEFSRIGVVSEDQYWVWLRDAVYFPKGVPGTYDRLIWKSAIKSRYPGIAVLPVLASGKIALNLNYRHATRSWEIELPRGLIHPEETLEQAARREIKEETGMIPSSLALLGEVAPDSGVLSSIVPVFIGKIASQGESNPDYSEAIAGVQYFTKQELKEGLIKGYVETFIEGKKRQVPLRDSFLTFALFQAELRLLL